MRGIFFETPLKRQWYKSDNSYDIQIRLSTLLAISKLLGRASGNNKKEITKELFSEDFQLV